VVYADLPEIGVSKLYSHRKRKRNGPDSEITKAFGCYFLLRGEPSDDR
jgi:hypothetical protein